MERLIIDMDPGIDDAAALFFALASPEVSIDLITTVFGNVTVEQATVNAQRLLAFASRGVTHVISFESNGGLSTLFLPNARTQSYYPRLGVNTASGSEALLETGVVTAKQFNGAVGFGWVPAVDLQTADYGESSPYSDTNRRHCRQVMRDHGITPQYARQRAPTPVERLISLHDHGL